MQAVASELQRAHSQGGHCSLLFSTGARVYAMVDGAVQVLPDRATFVQHRASIDEACGFLPPPLPTEAFSSTDITW